MLTDAQVLRCQLPKANPYYRLEPEVDVLDVTDAPADEQAGEGRPKLCALCGQRALQKCSACNMVDYCSRSHQRLHWKAEHNAACAGKNKGGDLELAAAAEAMAITTTTRYAQCPAFAALSESTFHQPN